VIVCNRNIRNLYSYTRCGTLKLLYFLLYTYFSYTAKREMA